VGGATSLTASVNRFQSRAVSHHGVLAALGVGRFARPHFSKQDNPAGVAVLSDKLWRLTSDLIGRYWQVVKLDGAPHIILGGCRRIRVPRRCGPLAPLW